MVTYDIGREPPQSCEVFGGVVLPGSVGVLGEDDIEDPMKPVLDAPMAADCVQQSFGGHVFGQQEVAHPRLRATLSSQATTGSDAGESDVAGNAVCRCDAGVANDAAASPLVPIVSGGFDPIGGAASASLGKAARNGLEQLALVSLESQYVIGASIQHCRGEGAI